VIVIGQRSAMVTQTSDRLTAQRDRSMAPIRRWREASLL